MMKIIICDSNKKVVDQLKECIERICIQDSVVGVQSIFELVTYLYDEAGGDADFLLINVRVSGDNGIKAAKEIQDFYPHIEVAFFAENCEYARDIFLIRPIYFLKLPLEVRHLECALNRAHELYSKELNQSLTLKFRKNIFRLTFSSIYYIESQGRKMILYTDQNQWEVNMTVAELLDKLPCNFKICHRSYIVNTDKIQCVTNSEIELINHLRIPVSRKRMAEFSDEI